MNIMLLGNHQQSNNSNDCSYKIIFKSIVNMKCIVLYSMCIFKKIVLRKN